jgi:hypothetical protein
MDPVENAIKSQTRDQEDKKKEAVFAASFHVSGTRLHTKERGKEI